MKKLFIVNSRADIRARAKFEEAYTKCSIEHPDDSSIVYTEFAGHASEVATKVREVEAHGRETGQHLLEHDRLCRRESDRLREEQLLSGHRMVLKLLQIALITDAHISPVLVDNHESRLDGSHDVTALILIVKGREVCV